MSVQSDTQTIPQSEQPKTDQQRIAALEEEVVELKERLQAIEEIIRFADEFNRAFMNARKSVW